MQNIKGINIYGEIGTPEVQKSISQFLDFMENVPDGVIKKAALMPDCHEGYSVPIGSVFAAEDMIYPAAVGYDIGCGMCAYQVQGVTPDLIRDNSKAIFDQIYRDIPVGFKHNQNKTPWLGYKSHIPSSFVKELFTDGNALNQLGSLGGGNHFIEVGEADGDHVWIVIHSGSRNLGHKIASHYMKEASGGVKAKEGAYGFDVNSNWGKAYIADMNLALEFALENRKEMIRRVLYAISRHTNTEVSLRDENLINRNHNHAVLRDGLWIHRKGATHAETGMLGVIPGNMRDGSFIVRGKGNPDSMSSSSHGAGRVMSRKKAKETIQLSDFQKEMKSVQARVNNSTIDESPFAYKNIFEVMELQKDLVEVLAHVRPILNIKG